MKLSQTLPLALACLTLPLPAQLPNYQGTVAGQSPAYCFHFDNTLSDSIGGSSAFAATGTAGFGGDCFNNASSAVSFPAVSDYLTGSGSILSGAGTSTAVGSLSLLLYVPATIPATGYFFSDSETTGGASGSQPANSAFALQFSSSALTLKVGNKSYSLPAVSAGNWYYLGLTYNLNGTVAGVNGINYYLGAAGGSLATGFFQKGGSGNLSTTSTLGDGNTLVLGNKQQAVVPTSAGTATAGIPGSQIDELATWNTQLTPDQIQAQFNALVVPEPSVFALLAAGGLLALRRQRKAGR